MQLDDLTSAGFLRRWHLLDGQPRCPFDAVDPGLISEADRAAILAQNAAVRGALAAVEAYEAAAVIATAEAPERYETIADPETGEESERETAAYQAWRTAWETVATTPPETLALAIVRTGLDEEGNPREPDPMPEDTVEILLPVEPVPDGPTNSDWRVGLIMWGRFVEVEQKVIEARDSGSVEGAIAWQRWEYANNVYRAELMALKDTFGFTAEEVNESLHRAAAVPSALAARA